MARLTETKRKIAFGDFQTPPSLADAVCDVLDRRGIKPASIVEPNCGKGSLVLASLEKFQNAETVLAADINPAYVAALQSVLSDRADNRAWTFLGDFYAIDWFGLLTELPQPILVLGNPPWVTNAGLSVVGSSNAPEKRNFQNHSGLDAITGKSNFDVSEWMLIRELEWLNGRHGTLAMLCKTTVARKTLYHAWKNGLQVSRSDIYRIDAMTNFGASVEACLLVCDFLPSFVSKECSVHESLQANDPSGVFGFMDSRLIADIPSYGCWKFLAGAGHRWRSGIKHDCSEVMELRKDGGHYVNGLGERIELEENHLYPMLKSSQLANGRVADPYRWMLVTQKSVGEDTRRIQQSAPKTWDYLNEHIDRFDRRKSSIYKGRSDFAVFGVGDYSFTPWKVAIPALYKKLRFKVVAPVAGKPVVFDDTCYFLPCQSQKQAEQFCDLLNSAPALEFYNSLIFWDAKRPITVEILRQLDVAKVARHLGKSLAPPDLVLG